MRAIVIIPDNQGGTLVLRDVPEPTIGPHEILIHVKASALNRADLLQRCGTYPAQPVTKNNQLIIGGLEAAGEVTNMGEMVKGFAIGDRVMAMCNGGYAERARVDYRLAMKVPESLSWEEAATIPVSYMTEHDALITNGQLQPGESVFINAASSGVGVAAIQLAKLLGAQPVIGSSRVTRKLQALLDLGMDIGIDSGLNQVADDVLAATNGKGVDIVLDHIGAPFLTDHMRCLAIKGRLISVGRLGGPYSDIDLEQLALKRIQLIGVTFRTRTLEERIAIVQRCSQVILPALAKGRLRPCIHRAFPFEAALKAQDYMASNRQLGKIVLTF